MTLPITIVGCGAVAQGLYRRPLQQLERRGMLRVVSLVDTNLDHARKLRRHFPLAAIASNLADALSDRKSQLTFILTPANVHARQSLVAFEFDNHVLCEKPMAMARADCQAMLASSESANRMLAVGMVRRFFPAFAQLKGLIEQGELGQVLSFDYREGRRFDWQVTTPAAFRPRDQGGTGVLFDIGPHAIDFLTWLLGSLEVTSYSDDALKGVEANALIALSGERCAGTVRLSWDCPLPNELRIRGTIAAAVLKLDHFDKLAVLKTSRFGDRSIGTNFAADLHSVPRHRVVPRTYGQAIYCQIVQVLRAVTLGEQLPASGKEGLRCISLLEDSLRLAQPSEMPWLSDGQREAYQQLHWTNAKWEPSRSLAPAGLSAQAS